MSQELLEGRWDETKDALLEGLQGSKRSSMSVTLKILKSICVRTHQLVLQHLVVSLH
jgi:hypothetical protein